MAKSLFDWILSSTHPFRLILKLVYADPTLYVIFTKPTLDFCAKHKTVPFANSALLKNDIFNLKRYFTKKCAKSQLKTMFLLLL